MGFRSMGRRFENKKNGMKLGFGQKVAISE